MRRQSVKNRQEKGIALATSMIILLLLSAIIAGIGWLVLGDQKLGGNNSDRQLAFYGAEAGMESLTASLENLFDANYAPDKTAINNLLTTPGPPSNIQGVQYLAPGNTTAGSGYQIAFVPSTANANLPSTSWGTIPSGTYSGLVGLMTPYTLTVTSHTMNGSEVRLQRYVQTVGIPVFQFGFFSQMDLSFFAGPNFNFGGRVHTNGNLWLAEGDGSTLTLSQKTTAAGEIITANLENGWVTTNNYNGGVNITNGSGVNNLIAQNPAQSVNGAANVYGNIGTYANGFANMATTFFNNYIAVAQTGVKPLNLAIATPAIGGQPIDLIRRPIQGEGASNPAKLAERYWSQVSLRILLSDYGASGGCTDSDISSTSATALPGLAANATVPGATPVDLAKLGWDTVNNPSVDGNTTLPYYSAPAALIAANVGKTIFPLPVSYANAGTTYSAANGYWVKKGYPIISGCLKIEYQDNSATPAWHDVTWTILNLGYTGRNVNPQVGNANAPGYVAPPALPGFSGNQISGSGPTANAGVATIGCQDPSPGAVIRLARVRDNPSNASGGSGSTNGNNWCGNNEGNTAGAWSGLPTKTSTCPTTTNATNCPTQSGTDYWPNVLYDTREALLRDVALGGTQLPLAGAMHYVELDVANLANCLTTTAICSFAGSVNNTTGYSIYFSDRRGDRLDPTPPASVGGANVLTGGFGYEDTVNPNSASGCPDASLTQGEDLEGDYNSSGVDPAPMLRTYGGTPQYDNSTSASVSTIALLTAAGVLATNPNCAGPGVNWPFALTDQVMDQRINAPVLFRRALKLVHGDTIAPTLGTCNSVPCGLSVIAENPVYVQGCYNNTGSCASNAFGTTVTNIAGASVIADAVTLLSDNWNDANSFAFPYNLGSRNATTTTYRLAVAAGKGIPFPQPTVGGVYQDFGTDGGAHNFLRYLENWGGQTLYYEGSIVSMYYNHQGVGVYKCCNTVYSPPTRGYNFDTNFLTPSLLPPLTPMLRTINTVGFTQMLLPTQ
jgi:PilX N-terminal